MECVECARRARHNLRMSDRKGHIESIQPEGCAKPIHEKEDKNFCIIQFYQIIRPGVQHFSIFQLQEYVCASKYQYTIYICRQMSGLDS